MIGKVLTIQDFFHCRLLNKKPVSSGIVTVFFDNLTVSTAFIIMIKIKIYIIFILTAMLFEYQIGIFRRKENFIYEIQLQ